jgi:hypothetical protein
MTRGLRACVPAGVNAALASSSGSERHIFGADMSDPIIAANACAADVGIPIAPTPPIAVASTSARASYP